MGGAASPAASIVPRARAKATVSTARTASCVVNALVEATPISGRPAFADDIGLARDRAFRLVDDGDDLLPLLAAIAQRGQRVGGLARLRDDDRGAALGMSGAR